MDEQKLFPDYPQNTTIPGVVIGVVTGADLRDEGMARAQAAANEEWKARVDQAIASFASTDQEFTAESVRLIAGDPPAHENAMGARFHNAARRGIIVRVGYTQAERAKGHARALAVWRGRG